MRSGGRLPAGFRIAAMVMGVLVFAGAAASPQANDVPPQRHVVDIRGMAFEPEVLEIRLGDTVVWINRDIVPHTATAARKSEWTTGPLLQGDSGRHVPRKKGEDPYLCELHPTMLGKLIIR